MGAAILCTLQLFRPSSPYLTAGKVRCFAFAPPPIFEPPSSLPGFINSCVFTFVHNMDCIPRASSGSMVRLLLAMQTVDNLALSVHERLKFLKGDYYLKCEIP